MPGATWKLLLISAALGLTAAIHPREANAMPTPPSEANSTRIRVRIASNLPKGRIRGFDLRINYVSVNRLSEWSFRCDRDRVLLSRGSEKKVLASPVVLDSPAGLLRFQDRPYRETIRIHAKGAFCTVINEVDLQKYLEGLVNAEFNSRWSEEATAAQVVAARTYAIYQMREARRKHADFDVDSTVKDQVYDGFAKEDFRASRIVARTAGLILTLPQKRNGKLVPLKAFYSSSCGGRTELPERVWGGKGQFPGFKHQVECPYCHSSPAFSWKLELTAQELQEAILNGVREGGAPKGWPRNWAQVLDRWTLTEIRAQYWNEQQQVRASRVITVWSDGRDVAELSVPAVRFRSWVGVSQLKSTAFHITMSRAISGNRWTFDGRGNGHGVGLCQWGAKAMGDRGYSMAAILKHYYPDAVLRKMW